VLFGPCGKPARSSLHVDGVPAACPSSETAKLYVSCSILQRLHNGN